MGVVMRHLRGPAAPELLGVFTVVVDPLTHSG